MHQLCPTPPCLLRTQHPSFTTHPQWRLSQAILLRSPRPPLLVVRFDVGTHVHSLHPSWLPKTATLAPWQHGFLHLHHGTFPPLRGSPSASANKPASFPVRSSSRRHPSRPPPPSPKPPSARRKSPHCVSSFTLHFSLCFINLWEILYARAHTHKCVCVCCEFLSM